MIKLIPSEVLALNLRTLEKELSKVIEESRSTCLVLLVGLAGCCPFDQGMTAVTESRAYSSDQECFRSACRDGSDELEGLQLQCEEHCQDCEASLVDVTYEPLCIPDLVPGLPVAVAWTGSCVVQATCACTDPDDQDDGENGGEPEVEVCDAVEVQPVDITDHADVLRIEGQRPYLDPGQAGALTVTVCSDHFPVGSQSYTNIQTALDLLADRPGYDLDVTLTSAPHPATDNGLFPASPTEVYRIDLTSVGPSGAMTATGGAWHYNLVNNCWYNIGQLSTCGLDATGDVVPSDYVVLGFRKNQFYDRLNVAGAVGTPDNGGRLEGHDEPSVGVISHEAGHSMHFGHTDDRTAGYEGFYAPANANGRAAWSHGPNPTLGSGLPDLKQGRVSAYAQAMFETVYPDPFALVPVVPSTLR